MTFKSIDTGKLNPRQKKYSFEIYGYDFMIDSGLKPWLIEVNTNPCLEETSKLLRSLLPRMIDDAFKLTLDVLFPPVIPMPEPKKAFPVEGYDDQDNLWQPIYTLKS